jgi:NAD(P)-dependent dehydrogenase (short-subunit alcohol dehydrogenase family)
MPPTDPFSLQGTSALVTGAAGHLGRGLCLAMGQAGVRLAVAGRDPRRLDALARDLAGAGVEAHPLPLDLGDAAACAAAGDRLAQCFDRLDILVNNAHSGRPGDWQRAEPGDFDGANRLAVSGPFALIRSLFPLLQAAAPRRPGGASVVNIASMYGTVSPDPGLYGETGMNSPPYYGAAKAGMIQLTRYLAVHLAEHRIRVNSLSPGPFPPSRVRERDPAFNARLCAKTPLGRLGEPGELAGPVLFLASDAASFVTGVNLPVDGGWTAW